MNCNHSKLLDVDSGWTSWRTSPNYVFCVQRNHSSLPPTPPQPPISPKAACFHQFQGRSRGRGGGHCLSASSLMHCESPSKSLDFQVTLLVLVNKRGQMKSLFWKLIGIVAVFFIGNVSRIVIGMWEVFLKGILWFLHLIMLLFYYYVVGP